MTEKSGRDEAERIFDAVFKAHIPSSVKRRFYEAANRLSSQYSQTEKEEYRRALSRISDLEALELTARYKKRLPLLVSHFRLMVRLGETLPENRKYFFNMRKKRLVWPWVLKFRGIRTAGKYVKGLFLLRSLKNV
jgi:hypothetical protein